MRKLFPMLLFTLLLALLMAVPALAADFTYDDFSATLTVPDSYTMLTTSNLADHEDLLAKQGLTVEAAQADWAARGVRFQAWDAAGDMCIELSAVQDDFAMQYWDVNEVTSDERATYRLGHSSDKNGYYRNLGYDYSSAQWKNGKNYARFLVLEYTRSHNGVSYAGYGRKSIRNGYSIYLECQVYGRSPKKADNNALQAILDTLKFNEIFPRPSSAVQRVTFDEVPPTETNSGKFTVSGTGTSGQYVILCLMRLSGGEPINYETQIPKNGKFSFTIQLPQEGVWLMTYTITDAGKEVLQEDKFSLTTYKKTLLIVNLDADLPEAIVGDTLTISGTTMRQTQVQCIIDSRYQKTITTNNSGKFSFKIDTSAEGTYDIVLTFQKKGYTTRRITSTATRALTEADKQEDIRAQADKPAYSTLTRLLDGYEGRYMVYTLFIDRVEQIGDEWYTFAAMRKTNSGGLRDEVVVRTTTQPTWQPADQVRMYLQCTGGYEIQGDATTKLPCFDYLFTD
jgi:hypothetical protein